MEVIFFPILVAILHLKIATVVIPFFWLRIYELCFLLQTLLFMPLHLR